ncbi:DUF3433 domain-containing protein [Phanerochaete sordida]|uniref:DUF3433 domain-containing protein n=1 Tax=Phanerochaete sordida TaxID=48140 RepID=A0A9P3G5T7_9APHY|nr:DUF3433 domain-containing protein [Phanerochaete sordida]
MPPSAPRIEPQRADNSAERLLDRAPSSDTAYRDDPSADQKTGPWTNECPGAVDDMAARPSAPVPLRPWAWVPVVLAMAIGGVGLEVALHFNERSRGWPTPGGTTAESGVMHYIYSFVPVAVVMTVAAFWMWTGVEVWKMQLARGEALLQPLSAWGVTTRSRRSPVLVGTLLAVLTFSLQPLAAALFNVQDVLWISHKEAAISLGHLSLNQDSNFHDLTAFSAAAGYVSADVLYATRGPPFVHNGYTVAPLVLPDTVQNGAFFVNTTAGYSHPSCVNADVGSLNMVQWANKSGWTNSVAFDGCQFAWSVDNSAGDLFGVDIIESMSDSCAIFTALPEFFRPVIFWFFTYEPSPMTSATLCAPNITLLDVNAAVDLDAHSLEVTPLGALGSHTGTLAQYAGNITTAYNGVFFGLDSPNRFIAARQDAIRFLLPAAIFQAAQASGHTQAFQENRFAGLAEQIYASYLSLVAKTVYFIPAMRPVKTDLQSVYKRLFLSPVVAHALAAAIFVMAAVGAALERWHARERRVLRLMHALDTVNVVEAEGSYAD